MRSGILSSEEIADKSGEHCNIVNDIYQCRLTTVQSNMYTRLRDGHYSNDKPLLMRSIVA